MRREILRLKFAGAYKKDLQLAAARVRPLKLPEVPILTLLKREPLPPEYKDHPLRGQWAGHREFHVQGDWIVIYRIENDEALVPVRTGTHSDLF